MSPKTRKRTARTARPATNKTRTATALAFAAIHWAEPSSWFDAPKQARSRDNMLRIVEAAIALFSEKGYDATSVIDIANAAGVTTGSIYRRFQDKKSVLNTIIEAYARMRLPEVERLLEPSAWSDASAAEIVDFYVDMLFSAYATDRQIVRIIESRAMADEDLLRAVLSWAAHNIALLERLLEPHRDSIPHADLRQGVTNLYTLLRNALAHLVLQDHALGKDDARVDSRAFREGVKVMARGYLLGDIAARP